MIEQTNHYYPFGMTFGEGIDNSDNRYKYNGKELDRMHGLDLYDYGARHYDAVIGRCG
jgi:RHS repeat-associated protein